MFSLVVGIKLQGVLTRMEHVKVGKHPLVKEVLVFRNKGNAYMEVREDFHVLAV